LFLLTTRAVPVRYVIFRAKSFALAELFAHDLHDVVRMAVVLGKDQGLGHLGTTREDFSEQPISESLNNRADLIFGDHAAVKLTRRILEIVIQLLPTYLPREFVALIHEEPGVHG